jgi:hypothetical protein
VKNAVVVFDEGTPRGTFRRSSPVSARRVAARQFTGGRSAYQPEAPARDASKCRNVIAGTPADIAGTLAGASG